MYLHTIAWDAWYGSQAASGRPRTLFRLAKPGFGHFARGPNVRPSTPGGEDGGNPAPGGRPTPPAPHAQVVPPDPKDGWCKTAKL
ncbi:hypothetical protein TNIN_7281 [Trichonephila inaurata madagascariensis]|uniref:Uncharacterized protein n=1 Tax=Trichonephila inaurata madagascariensis TaxID=2747483 RepID=A0A8X6I6S3_9ARAC|nr:hypothetical protein TNIN_7281 [Trichonephila inaurata madagascariensis]